MFDKKYREHDDTSSILPVANGSPSQYQNSLLKILSNYDGNGLGISLYKANNDLTNWDKLKLSHRDNYPPLKNPCN
jgi:hypothetical protein